MVTSNKPGRKEEDTRLTSPTGAEDDAEGEELDGARDDLGDDGSHSHLASVHATEREGHGGAHDEHEPAHTVRPRHGKKGTEITWSYCHNHVRARVCVSVCVCACVRA